MLKQHYGYKDAHIFFMLILTALTYILKNRHYRVHVFSRLFFSLFMWATLTVSLTNFVPCSLDIVEAP